MFRTVQCLHEEFLLPLGSLLPQLVQLEHLLVEELVLHLVRRHRVDQALLLLVDDDRGQLGALHALVHKLLELESVRVETEMEEKGDSAVQSRPADYQEKACRYSIGGGGQSNLTRVVVVARGLRYICTTLNQLNNIRRLPFMTSAKFSDFSPLPPLVRIFTQPPLMSSYT